MANQTPNPKTLRALDRLGGWEILRTDTGQSLCVITAHSRDEALRRAVFIADSIANMPEDKALLDAFECTEELRNAVACQDGYFIVFEYSKEGPHRQPIH